MLRTLLKFSGPIASSWALSWCLYRLRGICLIGRPHEEIWYFAYGANMHDSAFREWRGLRPTEWRPGRVRDTGCVSTSRDPPKGRTIYANLCADPAADVWGVLYKITRRDLVRLEATEGVPWWCYRPLWLDAEDMSRTSLHAATLTAEGDEDDYTPTLRYLTLLREGPRAHGLPDHYIRFLEQAEHGR
ncbi:MAG: gamma-glutamylcyclotransferase family protein [Rhodomicrobium sp.]